MFLSLNIPNKYFAFLRENYGDPQAEYEYSE